MADSETVRRLRSVGQRAWNSWRRHEAKVVPNLRRANLRQSNLEGRNLDGANLVDARLEGACLRDTRLNGANLAGADLSGCDLAGAEFVGANLTGARLRECSAGLTYFIDADFTDADLSSGDLGDCLFFDATFKDCKMVDANLASSSFGGTVFAGVDLSQVHGLETSYHQGPSVLDHRTLAKAASVPEEFLRGCGLPQTLIDHLDELFGNVRYHSCFISYASEDERFARMLERSLRNGGVRY